MFAIAVRYSGNKRSARSSTALLLSDEIVDSDIRSSRPVCLAKRPALPLRKFVTCERQLGKLRYLRMPIQKLPFDQRACFIAGAAKSGTTLLVALLDNHPELLVMPQDTAYFATVLTKYRTRGRRAQFDYLTKESWTNVLFGFQAMRGRQDYAEFPK